MWLTLLAAAVLAVAARSPARAEPAKLSIAAAANLVYALDALNGEFRRVAPEVTVTSTSGASGGLFAQLKHGAPFDVFLSADLDYPKQVIEAGLGDPTSLYTFATGRLVLWTMRREVDVRDVRAAVGSAAVRKIAIAQPKTAPYGRAAQAALRQADAWATAQPKLVFGESISQTAQFVESGNADIGFVALSLVVSSRLADRGRWCEVPAALYHDVSLAHAGVVTSRGRTNPAARQYMQFLRSDAARAILTRFGYAVP